MNPLEYFEEEYEKISGCIENIDNFVIEVKDVIASLEIMMSEIEGLKKTSNPQEKFDAITNLLETFLSSLKGTVRVTMSAQESFKKVRSY